MSLNSSLNLSGLRCSPQAMGVFLSRRRQELDVIGSVQAMGVFHIAREHTRTATKRDIFIWPRLSETKVRARACTTRSRNDRPLLSVYLIRSCGLQLQDTLTAILSLEGLSPFFG